MDFRFEKFLAKSTTITVFSDVDTPSPGFSTTTVSRGKEELGPGWAMDDVYPPLAELRRALLTDEEWAAMSSWEKDVWEMFYRPDWERLACIEQILEDTPPTQRAERHAEILEALRSLGASASVSVDHLDDSHAVSVDAASSAVVEEGPEDIHSASTGFITTTTATCSTSCLPRHPVVTPVLVASSPPAPTEYGLDTNSILVEAVPRAMRCEFPAVLAPTVQMQQPYHDSEFLMPTSSQRIASKVHVHRPMPWPSFLDGNADGDETRPLPWPSFKAMYNCESPSVAVMKLSQQCSYGSSSATLCDFIEFSVTAFYGNLSSSTGCIIIHNLCNSSEWRCLNGQHLFLEHSGFASDCVQPFHTNHALVLLPCTISDVHLLVMVRSLELKLLSIGPTPEAFVNSAIHAVSFWPGYFVTGSQMNLVFTAARRCSHWLVSGVCDGPTMSSLFTFRWYKWVLQPCDSGQQDASHDQLSRAFRHASYWSGNFVTVGQLQVTTACSTWKMFLSGPLPIRMATFLVWTKEQYGLLLYASELAREKLICMFDEFENWWKYMENLQLLKLTSASEQEALNSGFQFHWYMVLYLVQGLIFLAAPTVRSCVPALSLSSITADWHLHNQSTLTRPTDVCTTELGGTIGDMEAMPFTEALHRLSFSLVVKSLLHSVVACYLKSSIQWVASSDFEDVYTTSALEAHVTVHVLVIEVYIHVLGLGVAYTQEFNRDTPGRVILYMPEVPVIIDPKCQGLHRTISLIDSCSLSDATVVLLSFCGETQPLGFLLQGGTRDDLPSLVMCKLRLQNRQDNTQMKRVRLPRFHTFVWHVGKGYQDWLFARSAIGRVQPALLHVHAYQLSILAPAIFSSAWGNLDCISLILTGQGRSAELLKCRPSEASGYYSLADGGSLVDILKKQPLPWDPGVRHMTSLDRQRVFRFPWDPGTAAAAWGQAAFQGGRDVRDPSYTSYWAGSWAVVMGLTTHQQPGTELQIRNTWQQERHPDGSGRNRLSSLDLLASLLPHPCFSDSQSLLKSLYPNICIVDQFES